MEYSQENHALKSMTGESQGAKAYHRRLSLLVGAAFLTVTLFQTTVNTCVFNPWMMQALMAHRQKRGDHGQGYTPAIARRRDDESLKEGV